MRTPQIEKLIVIIETIAIYRDNNLDITPKIRQGWIGAIEQIFAESPIGEVSETTFQTDPSIQKKIKQLESKLGLINRPLLVSSVFGRKGEIKAKKGDYSLKSIKNDTELLGDNAAEVITKLFNTIKNLPTVPIKKVFGRVGNVLPAKGDYNSSLLINNSQVKGDTITEALNALKSLIESYKPKQPEIIIPESSKWKVMKDIPLTTAVRIKKDDRWAYALGNHSASKIEVGEDQMKIIPIPIDKTFSIPYDEFYVVGSLVECEVGDSGSKLDRLSLFYEGREFMLNAQEIVVKESQEICKFKPTQSKYDSTSKFTMKRIAGSNRDSQNITSSIIIVRP